MNFVYLDREALEALSTAIVNANDPKHDLYMQKIMSACGEYVAAVNDWERKRRYAFIRLEGEERREANARADSLRHAAHDNAIANVRMLNTLAAKYGLKPVFTGNFDKRVQVAEFYLELTNELFETRIR